MAKKISDCEFVIFDVETTGLVPKEHRIIEIGAVRCKGRRILCDFSSLINPCCEISAEAFAVNCISREMVEGAPLAKEVIPKFLSFCKGACLVGYNVKFDMGFLNMELELLGDKLPDKTAVVDALQMARRLMPGLNKYSLSSISWYLGINDAQEHRALSDVRLTVEVFLRLLAILEEKGIEDFMPFYNLFGFNRLLCQNLTNRRISAIQQAIASGSKLKIRYYSSSQGEITERNILPKEIFSQGTAEYLVGYCSLRKDERIFRINSILSLK